MNISPIKRHKIQAVGFKVFAYLVILLVPFFITGCSQKRTPIPTIISLTTSPMLDEKAEDLFADYHWTLIQKVAEYTVVLPVSFEHAPGDFPLAIYWAYNNEFNKTIGLNIEPYLGKKVVAIIYSLNNENSGLCTIPKGRARGIIINYSGTIIGAWIDQGRHEGFACSLDRKSFDEITQKTWSEWLVSSGVVNLTNEFDNKLAAMSPAEMITFFYAAIDRQDYASAYATFSRAELVKYLFRNMVDNALYNQSFADQSQGGKWGLENIASVKLVSLETLSQDTSYRVSVDMKFKQPSPTLTGDGTFGLSIEVTNEIESLGWRIESFGYGP